MNRYIVSQIYYKEKNDFSGRIGITNCVSIIPANNENEALGIYLKKNHDEYMQYKNAELPIVLKIEDGQYKRIIKKLWKKRHK
jgi:hypothetical protein